MLKKSILFICLFLLIALVLPACTSVSAIPVEVPAFSTPSATPIPTTTPTATPELTPEPLNDSMKTYTVPIKKSAFLSDRYPTADSSLRVCHNQWSIGKWDESDIPIRISGSFLLGDTVYKKGIGMYLEKTAFRTSAEGAESSASVTYTLNGEYDELIFDIGPDQSDSRYFGTDDGTASVQIFCDDNLVYKTNYFDGLSFGSDQHVDVRGASKLTIVLLVRRGSNNTLNIVLGNPKLVAYEWTWPSF